MYLLSSFHLQIPERVQRAVHAAWGLQTIGRYKVALLFPCYYDIPHVIVAIISLNRAVISCTRCKILIFPISGAFKTCWRHNTDAGHVIASPGRAAPLFLVVVGHE